MEKLFILPVLGMVFFSGNVLFIGETKVTEVNATITSVDWYMDRSRKYNSSDLIMQKEVL